MVVEVVAGEVLLVPHRDSNECLHNTRALLSRALPLKLRHHRRPAAILMPSLMKLMLISLSSNHSAPLQHKPDVEEEEVDSEVD